MDKLTLILHKSQKNIIFVVLYYKTSHQGNLGKKKATTLSFCKSIGTPTA